MQTALIIPVPEAEAAVGVHRAKLDSSARDGIPAHLTVLFPFVEPTTENLARAAMTATVPPFDFTLTKTAWFGERVLYLAPEDPEPFNALTRRYIEAFPGTAMHGGEFADLIPHLTIGHDATVEQLKQAEAAVTPHLPISCRATECQLWQGVIGEQWILESTWLFGA